MLFAHVYTDDIIRQGDKLRIDATKSFATPPETLSDIEIVQVDPGDGTGLVTVKAEGQEVKQKDWYLDWVYNNPPLDGLETYTITVRLAKAGDTDPQTTTMEIQVIDEATDNLWSTDQDLEKHEPNIRQYLKNYRFNFNQEHRRAQTMILEWLDQMKFTMSDGVTKITKDKVLVTEEMREWSTFKTLELIYAGNSNIPDDNQDKKARDYFDEANRARTKQLRGVDWNNSGEIEVSEHQQLDTCDVIQVTRRVY